MEAEGVASSRALGGSLSRAQPRGIPNESPFLPVAPALYLILSLARRRQCRPLFGPNQFHRPASGSPV